MHNITLFLCVWSHRKRWSKWVKSNFHLNTEDEKEKRKNKNEKLLLSLSVLLQVDVSVKTKNKWNVGKCLKIGWNANDWTCKWPLVLVSEWRHSLHIFQLYPQKTWAHIQHGNFRIFLNFLKQLINIVRSLNWLAFILHFHPRGFPISEEVWAQFWTCFKPHSYGRKFIASRPLAPYLVHTITSKSDFTENIFQIMAAICFQKIS